MSKHNSDSLAALKGLADAPSPVTAETIHAFLADQPELKGQDFRVLLNSEALAAGASGGTILFEIAGEQASDYHGSFVLRYELGGAGIFSQTSLPAQFELMRALGAQDIPVPEAIWLDKEGRIAAGHPALIMRRVFAHAPSIQYLQNGFFANSNDALRETMMRNLFGLAAKLHAIPVDTLSLPILDARGGADKHFLDREIDWALAELHAKFPDQEEGDRAELHTGMRKALEEASEVMREYAPRDRPPVISHGDLTIANTMFRDDGSIAALLDWELTHYGLPGMDVAYFLAAMAGIAEFGDQIAPMPTEEDTIRFYTEAGGTLDDFAYCRAFAAYRVATWGAIGMRRMPREFWPAQKRMWEVHHGLLTSAIDKLGA